MFSSIVLGIDVENVKFVGEGTIDGNATFNPETGEFIEALGGQGYSSESSWSRLTKTPPSSEITLRENSSHPTSLTSSPQSGTRLPKF